MFLLTKSESPTSTTLTPGAVHGVAGSQPTMAAKRIRANREAHLSGDRRRTVRTRGASHVQANVDHIDASLWTAGQLFPPALVHDTDSRRHDARAGAAHVRSAVGTGDQDDTRANCEGS